MNYEQAIHREWKITPKLTYGHAMELYPIVSRRPENKILLNLIAEAIMKEKLK